jgi:hypothetical protein
MILPSGPRTATALPDGYLRYQDRPRLRLVTAFLPTPHVAGGALAGLDLGQSTPSGSDHGQDLGEVGVRLVDHDDLLL